MLGSSVFFSSELVFVVDVSVVVVLVAGLLVEVVLEGRVVGLEVSGLLFELGLLVSVGRVAGLPVVVEPEGGVVGLVVSGLLVSAGRIAGLSGCGLTVGAGFSGCGLTGVVGRTGYTGYTGTGFGSIMAGGTFSYIKSYLLSLPLRNSTA
ncbi:hypothetical protein [Dysgonomonas reticulitermitis]